MELDETEYPKELWVYNRNGKLEVRDDDIVVGNVKYVRVLEASKPVDDSGEVEQWEPDLLEYYPCLTGDECGHQTQAECDAAFDKLVADIWDNKEPLDPKSASGKAVAVFKREYEKRIAALSATNKPSVDVEAVARVLCDWSEKNFDYRLDQGDAEDFTTVILDAIKGN